jgi:hypothetical protein
MSSSRAVRAGAWMMVALLSGAGCAMRVSGVVRDKSTGYPIGGAVLLADDGRNRLAVTDPLGRYALKTDRKPTALTVSAPSYQTAQVPVGGDSGAVVADVDLQSTYAPPTREPLVKPIEQVAGGVPVAEEHIDGAPAAKFKQLEDLYDRGLISKEEYQQARKRIIGGL